MNRSGIAVSVAVLLFLAAPTSAHADLGAPRTSKAAIPDPQEAGRQVPEEPPRVANYRMDASLDTKTHRLESTGTITWRNTSRVPVTQLHVHLYLNGFRDDQTRFMRTPVAGGRGSGRLTRYGSIEVTRFFVKRFARDLWPPATERVSPGDSKDSTDIVVKLPAEVMPGESLEIEMAWTCQLPSVFLRTGYAGAFHMVAQWFPKIARLEPDGTWAHFPFARLGEFYADFGNYDVTIAVDEGYTVAAPGRARANVGGRAGKHVVRYILEPAHDFAFAVFDAFAVSERRLPNGPVLRGYAPRGLESELEFQLALLERAIPEFSERYGVYPYESLTIVHPPEVAREAGGMEYPGLITTGGAWWLRSLGVQTMANVTVHELAHQWFYGLVATNEHDHPFLDEGLASFAQADWMTEARPGGSAASVLGFRLDVAAVHRAFAAGSWGEKSIAGTAPSFGDGRHYAPLVYGATSTILETLARRHGRERVRAMLRAYALKYRWRHPGPEQWLGVVEDHFEPLTVSWVKRTLFDRAWVDWRVALTSNATKARVTSRGGLKLPVAVLLTDHNNRSVTQTVSPDSDGVEVGFVDGRPIRSAEVDPSHVWLIERNRSNNAVRRSAETVSPRTLLFGQLLTQWLYGALGP